MKKYKLIPMLMVALFSGASLIAQSQKPLEIGIIHTLDSKVLNEKRTLNIFLPDSFDRAQSYPVIYLLDGSMHEDFLHVAGLVQFFNLQFKMPPHIIVGIANVDRKKDFTFPTTLEDLKAKYPTTGGSENFMNFIEKEVQPFIEKNYPVSDRKYLIGQSLGGLLSVEILLKKPQLFSHYLIVGPSLWWNNESLLDEADDLIENQDYQGKYVYISVGKEGRIMESEAKKIYKKLQKSDAENFRLDFRKLPEENHATVLHNALYQGFLKLYPFQE